MLALALSTLPAAAADDDRAQYPSWLANSYVDLDLGAIHYPFSQLQLEPGFKSESILSPPIAVRVLFGHPLGRHLAAQISYMRPVEWVKYKKVNDGPDHTVWMNVLGMSLRSSLSVTRRLSLNGELGLGVVTRSGFKVEEVVGVQDISYTTVLLGGGLQYHLNNRWDAGARATYVPDKSSLRQPQTLLLSGGVTYNLRPLSEASVRESSQSAALFPRSLVQAGFTTDGLGIGANRFFSSSVPIFWGGLANVHRGVSLRYQRNVFHSRRVFALDWGASLGIWKSAAERQSFYTLSVYPMLRFTALRRRPADLYFAYSAAGPTRISRPLIDGEDTGRRFTFQDSMAIGAYFGRTRQFNAELRISHYSNGNIFPRNAGVLIPLTFCVGRTF